MSDRTDDDAHRHPEVSAESPIGVFDSGVGGLTVVAALRRRLPDESIVYLGDTARLPYGSKSPETVTQYTRKNVDFLLQRGVKAVVVACNTDSALALPHLRAQRDQPAGAGGATALWGVPVWGVIGPGARAAAAATAGRVGVIATESTVRSDAYARALAEVAPEVRVSSRACPLFVPLVEEGWHDDPVTEQVAARYLEPLLRGERGEDGDGIDDGRGIDTLVLGCTHYPLLQGLLQRVVGPGVTLVDSAASTAEEVARGLEERGLLASGPAAEPRLHVTDANPGFADLARRILGDDEASLEWVEVT